MAEFTPQEIEQFLQQFFDVVGARQYVGARYVPIFGRAGEDSIEWDDTAPYEPLTVVMHAGVSYVSRRYVPAGVDITDTDYWVETYRFNAQVEQYRQEVLAFDGRITAVEEGLDDVTDTCIPWPNGVSYAKYGTDGQVLRTFGNGDTEWVDQQLPSEELMRDAVDDWLAENPLANIFIESVSSIVTTSNYQTVLPNANDVRGTKAYRLVFPGNTTTLPANLPVTSWPPSATPGDTRSSALLFSIAGSDSTTSRVQLLVTAKQVWIRSYLGSSWHNWQLVDNGAYYENPSKPVVTALKQQVDYTNYATVLPDLDAAPLNTLVRIISLGSEASHTWPAHLPEAFDTTLTNVMVLTLASDANLTGGLQLFIPSRRRMWARVHTSQGWLPWTALTVEDPSLVVSYKSTNYTVDQTLVNRVDYTNYATVLPDLDAAPKYERYRIVSLGSEASQQWPANVPNGAQPTGELCVSVFECLGERSASYSSAMQAYYNKRGYWIREYAGGAWQGWVQIAGGDDHRRKIVVGPGQAYTNFSKAIIDAYAIGDCDVYVNPGTYSIKTEMEVLYGADYWTNLSTSSPWFNGLPLGNGMRVYGSPGVVVRMDASQVPNTVVWDQFSVFMNQTTQGATQRLNSVHGIRFDCTCIRYCIHLDRGATEMDDTYLIEDCELFLDNTNNTMKTFAYCIGMGASVNTIYQIRDCYFYAVRPENPRDVASVYYHNTNAASPQNLFVIEGCYVDNGGTIRIDAYGDSQNECKVMVSNNSVGAPLVLSTVGQNIKALVWNNEDRSA